MARPHSDSTVFQAIACPTRRAVLDALCDGEQHVTALVDRLAVTQSAVSQHLGILKTAGLIAERKQGRFHYYRARLEPLLEVQEWVERYRAEIERQLDALGGVLDTLPDDTANTPEPKSPRRSREAK